MMVLWCLMSPCPLLKSTPRPPELRAERLQQDERIKRSDKRSDRISSKMLEYALIECQTIEWHIKYKSICQLLSITRSIFVGTWYFARLIIIVIIAIISQAELCTILFDDVFPVTYDKDIDLLTRPWLLWPAACYRKHCGCLVFRNACEEIPTEKKLTVLISDVVRRCPMLKVKHPLKWFYDAPNLSGVHRKCIEILDSVWVQFQ